MRKMLLWVSRLSVSAAVDRSVVSLLSLFGRSGVLPVLAALLLAFYMVQGQAFVSPRVQAVTEAVADSAAPVIEVPEKVAQYDLKPGWESVLMGIGQAAGMHPQQIWAMPESAFEPGGRDRKLGLDASKAYWARFTLRTQVDERNGNAGYLLVPSATIDAVYIWLRPRGGDWLPAVVAGDTFAKTDWTVRSNFAAAPLPDNTEEVDVVVRMENHFNLFTRMLWLNQAEYLEGFYYTNRTLGASMGEVGAVLILSLLAFAFLRRREFFALSLLCLAMVLHQLAYSGSGRDVLWGGSGHLNAVSIEASSYLTACCLLVMVWSLMSRQLLSREFAWLTWLTVCAGLLLVVWHYFRGYISPFSNWLLLFYTLLSLLVSAAMSLTMLVLRKDRVALWVFCGVLAFGIFVLLTGLSRYYLLPRDHFHTLASVMFTLSVAVFFVASYARYRFGHTVMSEEAVFSRSGDTLTGLMDRDGLMQVMALSNLRHVRRESDAENALTPVMVVRLRKVEERQASVQELGSAMLDAAQIRLAYILKNEFQDMPGGANIARVQEGCFVLFLGSYMEKTMFQQHATRIVTQLLTMDDLPAYKTTLGLQMVLDHVPAYELSTPVLQRLYNFGNRHSEDPRVIMWVESDSVDSASGGGGADGGWKNRVLRQ